MYKGNYLIFFLTKNIDFYRLRKTGCLQGMPQAALVWETFLLQDIPFRQMKKAPSFYTGNPFNSYDSIEKMEKKPLDRFNHKYGVQTRKV